MTSIKPFSDDDVQRFDEPTTLESINDEHFQQLEKHLTGKGNRAKKYGEVSVYLQEVIQTRDLDRLSCYVDVLFKSDVKIIEGFFLQDWNKLSDEQKRFALTKLVALPGEKGTVRQAVTAHSLADTDPKAAAFVLFNILGGGQRLKKVNPILSKEKRSALRTRFFSSPEAWRDFDSPDPEILQTILFAFCSIASDIEEEPKAGSIGVTLKYAKWVINILPRLNLSKPEAERIDSSLQRAVQRLPGAAREELLKLKARVMGLDVGTDAEARANADPVLLDVASREPNSQEPSSNDVAAKKKETDTSLRRLHNDVDHCKNPAPFRSPEQLLVHKREALLHAEKEIEVLSQLIEDRNAARERISSLHNSLDSATEQGEKLKQQVKDLTERLYDIEKLLAIERESSERASIESREILGELNAARSELEKKASLIESERSEFAASSENRVKFEAESFRGVLRQKLRPIFENKRQTDSFEADAELASFLRGWFLEIEAVLTKNGIRL